MTRTLPTDDRPPAGIRSWRLWLSLLVGIVIWSVHVMIVYPITSLACHWGWFGLPGAAGQAELRLIQIVATAVAALLVSGALLWAIQARRKLPDDDDPREPGSNRFLFMTFMSITLNSIFLALIVLALAPILILPACGMV